MGGRNFRNILPIKEPKSDRGKIYVFCPKNFIASEYYYLEPGLYPSITDIVEATDTLFQETRNHSETCTTVKVSRRTQKVKIYLENEKSGHAFFSMDLGHTL